MIECRYGWERPSLFSPKKCVLQKSLKSGIDVDARRIGGTDRYPGVAISDKNANTAFVKD